MFKLNKFAIKNENIQIQNCMKMVGVSLSSDKHEINLNVETLKFNDGSIRATIPDLPKCIYEPSECVIDVYLHSMDDLMIVAQCKNIINNYFSNLIKFTLKLKGTLYTRYDRVMFKNKTDAFGGEVFANFVNSLKFDTVFIYDPHSNVIVEKIHNAHEVKQETLTLVNRHYFNVICPDAGALKKLESPNLIFDKARNPETGKIEGIELKKIININDNFEYLVVDDICEGGGTFLGLADSIMAEFEKGHLPKKPINLHITYGIFSNNAIEKLLEKYSKIYVYYIKSSLYNSLTVEQKSRVIFSKALES